MSGFKGNWREIKRAQLRIPDWCRDRTSIPNPPQIFRPPYVLLSREANRGLIFLHSSPIVDYVRVNGDKRGIQKYTGRRHRIFYSLPDPNYLSDSRIIISACSHASTNAFAAFLSGRTMRSLSTVIYNSKCIGNALSRNLIRFVKHLRYATNFEGPWIKNIPLSVTGTGRRIN